ncbi:hypothetical protein Q9189_007649 [Teloschistes chrysophthalmus]
MAQSQSSPQPNEIGLPPLKGLLDDLGLYHQDLATMSSASRPSEPATERVVPLDSPARPQLQNPLHLVQSTSTRSRISLNSEIFAIEELLSQKETLSIEILDLKEQIATLRATIARLNADKFANAEQIQGFAEALETKNERIHELSEWHQVWQVAVRRRHDEKEAVIRNLRSRLEART